MKNLKKVLALVLVVAMMASFAVSAGAASFTDNAKIVYDNAVKLLSDLDVINGFTDGSFNPEGNVTRAQTAKMIAKKPFSSRELLVKYVNFAAEFGATPSLRLAFFIQDLSGFRK